MRSAMDCPECLEQARLLGMSAERELKLRAEIEWLTGLLAQFHHGASEILGELAGIPDYSLTEVTEHARAKLRVAVAAYEQKAASDAV